MLHNGWEIEEWAEGGQPNGTGEIEPSDAREWFRSERETHHRKVISLIGPWEDGPTAGALAESRARARGSRRRGRRAARPRGQAAARREATS